MDLTADFWEKVLLLLLTALVTGFAVPFVLKRIEERRARSQKQFEAELARQAKVIEAQVKLIDDLGAALWEFQLALIDVLYSRQFDEARYRDRRKDYEANAAQRLGRIRTEISKSIRLVSRRSYEELKRLYYEELLSVDMQLSVLTRDGVVLDAMEGSSGKTGHERIRNLHAYAVGPLAERVDQLLDSLSSELALKAVTERLD